MREGAVHGAHAHTSVIFVNCTFYTCVCVCMRVCGRALMNMRGREVERPLRVHSLKCECMCLCYIRFFDENGRSGHRARTHGSVCACINLKIPIRCCCCAYVDEYGHLGHRGWTPCAVCVRINLEGLKSYAVCMRRRPFAQVPTNTLEWTCLSVCGALIRTCCTVSVLILRRSCESRSKKGH